MKSARLVRSGYGVWTSRRRRPLPKRPVNAPVNELERFLASFDARHALRMKQQRDMQAYVLIAHNAAAADGLPSSLRQALIYVLLAAAAMLGFMLLG